jgi:hypothetical protein
VYEIAVIRKGASPQRSTAANAEELREAVFALIRAEVGTILESDHAGLAAFVAPARAAVDNDGFVAVEFGPLTFTIRARDDAEPTKDSAAEPVAEPPVDGCRVLRADQLTRGMTVRLKDPADLGPVDYNRWFTIVELVPGRRRTVAPLRAPLTPGDLIAPMAADSLWLVKDTGVPADLPASTLGIHGPLAAHWSPLDPPTSPID